MQFPYQPAESVLHADACLHVWTVGSQGQQLEFLPGSYTHTPTYI